MPVVPSAIAGTPVQGSTTLVIPAGESADSEVLFDTPPGTILIVEYVTIGVDSRNPDEQAIFGLRTTLDGERVLHRLGPLPPLLQTGIGSGRGIDLQRNLRLYADAPVVAIWQRGTGFDIERVIATITFTGRLVPAP